MNVSGSTGNPFFDACPVERNRAPVDVLHDEDSIRASAPCFSFETLCRRRCSANNPRSRRTPRFAGTSIAPHRHSRPAVLSTRLAMDSVSWRHVSVHGRSFPPCASPGGIRQMRSRRGCSCPRRQPQCRQIGRKIPGPFRQPALSNGSSGRRRETAVYTYPKHRPADIQFRVGERVSV